MIWQMFVVSGSALLPATNHPADMGIEIAAPYPMQRVYSGDNLKAGTYYLKDDLICVSPLDPYHIESFLNGENQVILLGTPQYTNETDRKRNWRSCAQIQREKKRIYIYMPVWEKK